MFNLITPTATAPAPTCVRCGQVHRTHVYSDTEEGPVGYPCWSNEEQGELAEVTYPDSWVDPVEVLGPGTYPRVREFTTALDSDQDTLTDEQAAWVCLLRFPRIDPEQLPVLYDVLGAWMQAKDAEPEKLITGDYLGVEKERVERLIRVTKIVGPYVSEHGDSWLCIMETVDSSDSCIWWTGDNLAFDEGKEYKIRGTVKKLDVYNGKRQTVLTRVKEV